MGNPNNYGVSNHGSRNKGLNESLQSTTEIESFPGFCERRHFLRSSLIAVAAVVALKAARNVSAQTQTPVTAPIVAGVDRLGWDDFLKSAVPFAQQLIAEPTFGVDEYLYHIGSLATWLKEIPDSPLGPYSSVDRRVWFGPSL